MDARDIFAELATNGVLAILAGLAFAAVGSWIWASASASTWTRSHSRAAGLCAVPFLFGIYRLLKALFDPDALGAQSSIRHAPFLLTLLGVVGLEAGALTAIW
jgi:hypothetical protein